MTEREEVLLELGFVLHRHPFRNTSQLIECLTIDHGRVGLVAQGSRQSGQRALLQPFAPLRLSWIKRRELGRLTNVEAISASLQFSGERLLAGFYVNELILRMSARDDPNADVFACYNECLIEIASHVNIQRTLRLFELDLLRALGYGLDLERDTQTGEAFEPDRRYVFELESGARLADAASPDNCVFSGRELISLRRGLLDDQDSLRAAKRLLGRVLKLYLGDRPLKTRSVFKDILEIGL